MCAEKTKPTPVERSHRLVQLGIAALDANNPGEAISHLEQALGFQNGNPDAYYYLARALNAIGGVALAKETLSLAQDRLPSVFSGDGTFGPYPTINFFAAEQSGADSEVRRSHELMSQAQKNLDRGDPAGAIPFLLDSLEVNPWNPHAYYHLARAFAHTEEPAKARAVFDKAIIDFPFIFTQSSSFGEYQGNTVDAKTTKAYYEALAKVYPGLLNYLSPCPEVGISGDRLDPKIETYLLRSYTEALETWRSGAFPEPSKSGVFGAATSSDDQSVLLVAPQFVRCTPDWDEYVIYLHLKGTGAVAFEKFQAHEADAIHTENFHLVEPRSNETLSRGIEALEAHLDRFRPSIVLFEGTFMGGQQCIDREELGRLKVAYGFKLATLIIDAHRPLPNYAEYWSSISDLILSQNEHPYLDIARLNCPVLVGPVLPVDFAQMDEVKVEKKDLELLFVGARRGYRDLWLAHLLDAGLPLFHRFTDKSAENSVGQKGYIKLLKRGRATISSGLVFGQEHTINFRIFEAIAAKTTLLQLDSAELKDYFVPYVHYAPFSNVNQLISTARFLGLHPKIGESLASEALAWYRERYAATLFWRTMTDRLEHCI